MKSETLARVISVAMTGSLAGVGAAVTMSHEQGYQVKPLVITDAQRNYKFPTVGVTKVDQVGFCPDGSRKTEEKIVFAFNPLMQDGDRVFLDRIFGVYTYSASDNCGELS